MEDFTTSRRLLAIIPTASQDVPSTSNLEGMFFRLGEIFICLV